MVVYSWVCIQDGLDGSCAFSRVMHRLVGVTGSSQEVFCHASVPSPCYKNASHHWDGMSRSGTDERGEPITLVSDWYSLSIIARFYRPSSGSASGLRGYTMRSDGSTLGALQPHGVIQMSVTWGTSSLIRHEPYWFQVTEIWHFSGCDQSLWKV